jgi:bifunctional non-homologous end joining protein LigD
MSTLLLRTRPAPSDFIEPCLPSTAPKPPSGAGWIHEIKHDGYRVMVRRDAAGVRILTRNGHDWTSRFPLIASAANALRAKSFLIDGEAVACDDSGLAVFQRLRKRKNDASVFLYAFDLVQLNGHDLRREPVEVRKAALEKLLRPKPDGIRFCEHVEFDDAAMMFEHACQLGCEGIVSKRIGSRYVSGRSRDWIKTKNPNAPAVRREAEEDWR